MNNREIAAKAADHIEKVGLNQDGRYWRGASRYGDPLYAPSDFPAVKTLPCCTLGAAVVVGIRDLDSWNSFINDFNDYIRKLGDNPDRWIDVTTWSDEHDQATVVATLRAFARGEKA